MLWSLFPALMFITAIWWNVLWLLWCVRSRWDLYVIGGCEIQVGSQDDCDTRPRGPCGHTLYRALDCHSIILGWHRAWSSNDTCVVIIREWHRAWSSLDLRGCWGKYVVLFPRLCDTISLCCFEISYGIRCYT